MHIYLVIYPFPFLNIHIVDATEVWPSCGQTLHTASVTLRPQFAVSLNR